MSNLEKVFIKEFKRRIRGARENKNIYQVPLPEEVNTWKVSGAEVLGVRGISSEVGLFSMLNKTLVKKLPSGVAVRRRKVDLVNRCFVKDSNGRYVYEDVKVPSGSMAVLSSVNLKLPYNYKAKEEGFGYIDFVTNGSEREFMYYIPKKYLYMSNQTALALSVKNMKNYFGMGYVSWNFGTIFLHIIPYQPNRSYVGTKILKTSHKVNYNGEVKKIVDFWINSGVIPDINLCNTISEGNLVLKETTRGYDSYEPIEELSLVEKEVYWSSPSNKL